MFLDDRVDYSPRRSVQRRQFLDNGRYPPGGYVMRGQTQLAVDETNKSDNAAEMELRVKRFDSLYISTFD